MVYFNIFLKACFKFYMLVGVQENRGEGVKGISTISKYMQIFLKASLSKAVAVGVSDM